ncbi:uncharacterized protein CIMG_05606 [Coccidioides immitis RS]|uniref:C2 domain-containing protein n=1 Tax=Coccidioides immitis (strain RS) TaxID=246410 RepID=A0A0E1RXS9_COCIM|nr:uncharacterized protein CIMG_05606 [Coccidioides immitis RS]EAS34582.2 hypothetical protein CIMG_05606 [Coccidioides immitis RS]
MLSKSAKLALGAHTAGIYADMSIDGPEIGTLVAIIDRAKNLPNRKTMGKQNPYCACRLAKEAKKTDTDMRGGQTPKWDQELRFTVHQSPDYYQLKVSVFNDDKKTDLIGETWVDLKGVIIPGGGQSDSWHNLNCKGKYAGEIRIELTYYDTRPKDEAVVERRKEAKKVEARSQTNSSISGPRQSKPPKRRPLPADPTGSTPARPSSVDVGATSKKEHAASTPSRPSASETQPTSPLKTSRRSEAPDDSHQYRAPSELYPPAQSSAPVRQDHHNSDRSYSHGPGQQGYQTAPDNQYPSRQDHATHRQVYYAESNIEQSAPALHPYQSELQNSHPPRQDHPPSHQVYYTDPNLEKSTAAHQSCQGELQVSDPPPRVSASVRQSQNYPNDLRSGIPSTTDIYHHRDSYNQPAPSSVPQEDLYPTSEYGYDHQQPPTDPYPEQPGHSYAVDQYQAYSQNSYETPSRHNNRQMATPEHRQNSYPPPSKGSPHGPLEVQSYGAPDHPQQLALNSGERRGQHHYYNPASKTDFFKDSPLRQSVSQANYHHHHQYLQPDGDDDDDDDDGPPPPPPVHRDGLGHSSMSEHFMSDSQPMPEPLNITPRSSPQPIEKQSEYIAYRPKYSDSGCNSEAEQGYSTSPAPSYRTAVQERGYLQERPMTSGGESVPSSLVAGYDPGLAKEPDRMHYDNRHVRRQSNIPTQSSTITQAMRSSPVDMPERRSPRTVVDPRQIPARKSVSPHPAPPPTDPDSLSGIPFSPDSYDVINPNASLASGVEQPAPPYENVEQAMEAARQYEVDKLRALGPIIGNDGRTIDPSDHLPADTWAPEPVRKQKKPEVVVRFKHAPASSITSGHSSSADRERQPRPRSVVAPGHSYQHCPPVYGTESHPPSRGRLQKAPMRPQSYIQPSPSARDPSPRPNHGLRERDALVAYNHYSSNPSAPSHYNGCAPPPYSDSSPSSASRYSSSVVSHRYHSSGPPIPAKVPIQPGSQTYMDTPSGHGHFDALSEEMKRIDIGVGKGGRKGRTSFIGGYGR